MNKPYKLPKPCRCVIEPQDTYFEPDIYWSDEITYNHSTDTPVDYMYENFDFESDVTTAWKDACLYGAKKISLAKAIEMANEYNIPLDEMYFGVLYDDEYINAALYKIVEKENPYQTYMVSRVEAENKRYEDELKNYHEQNKQYKLQLRQYAEHQKQEAEQILRELEREDE